jgi:hypothetical protein
MTPRTLFLAIVVLLVSIAQPVAAATTTEPGCSDVS